MQRAHGLTQRHLDQAVQQAQVGVGRTGTERRILIALLQEEGQTPMGLTARLFLSPSTIVGGLARLESRGLIFRRPSDEDRRASVVTLTEEGRQVAQDIHQVVMQELDAVFEGFDEEQATWLNSLLRHLLAYLEERTPFTDVPDEERA
jgi:DNA-binding MarR family transcriptional regulator